MIMVWILTSALATTSNDLAKTSVHKAQIAMENAQHIKQFHCTLLALTKTSLHLKNAAFQTSEQIDEAMMKNRMMRWASMRERTSLLRMQKDIEQLSHQENMIERKNRSTKKSSPISKPSSLVNHHPLLPFASSKGNLPWPVEGRILRGSGEALLGTRSANDGIFIEVQHAQSVQMVYPGVVVFSGTLGDLGNTVVVDHGHDFHSIYGQLDQTLVSVGQKMSQNSVLGIVGENSILYFEMRRNTEPLEPIMWLHRK